MAVTHLMNVALATKYGTNEALFLSNVCWWIEKNIANQTHFYEERYWTYNSMTAFAKLFPYFKEHQIRHIIDKLKEEKVLFIGNFNRTGFDRTQWYSVSDEVLALYRGIPYISEDEDTDQLKPEQETAEDTKSMPKPVVSSSDSDQPVEEQLHDSAIFPKGQIDVRDFSNASALEGKSNCDFSQIDLRDFSDRFEKSRRPIPADKLSKNTVAAPPEKTAVGFRNEKELRKEFEHLHASLVFDKDFYKRAISFMAELDVNSDYISWLFDYVRNKKPDSVRGLYYTLFFKPDILHLFLKRSVVTPEGKSIKQINMIDCPSCKTLHDESLDSCPSCGLAKEHRTDEKEIHIAQKINMLSPEEKKEFQNDILTIYKKSVELYITPQKMQEIIYKKYRISEVQEE
jgi:hypothetical protein